MDFFTQLADISLLKYLPELVAWGTGITLAILMVRRGGSKAERLLLAGCCLMLIARVLSVTLRGMIPWLQEEEISAQGLGLIMSISGIPSLAGFVCLIIAFWMRFRRKRQETS